MKRRYTIESHRTEETKRIGRLIGRHLIPGSVVALSGELGTGKTQFIKGLARGVGVNRSYAVSSPSFVLINEYPGRIPLYHVDLYRLPDSRELEEMGLEEYFYGDGVTAIEWAEKAASLMPSRNIWIDIQWTGRTSRRLLIKAAGKPNVQILDALSRRLERIGS